jgi:predicted RNA-binding Zn ribbon-like protein
MLLLVRLYTIETNLSSVFWRLVVDNFIDTIVRVERKDMDQLEQAIEPFDFNSNRLCLDFANTLHDRPTSTPRDHFNTYSDLVWWSQAAGILLPEETQILLAEARRRPAKATQVLQDAIFLRETLYRIFSSIYREYAPTMEDLHALNATYVEAMSKACIIQKENGFAWDWNGKETALERMLWDIARSAAELLVSTELHLLRECAADDCGWLFLDISKNHSRRWCDMKGCGNRAKVGKHYERVKQKQQHPLFATHARDLRQ